MSFPGGYCVLQVQHAVNWWMELTVRATARRQLIHQFGGGQGCSGRSAVPKQVNSEEVSSLSSSEQSLSAADGVRVDGEDPLDKWARMPRVLLLFLLWAGIGSLLGVAIRLVIGSPRMTVLGLLFGAIAGAYLGVKDRLKGKGPRTSFKEALAAGAIIMALFGMVVMPLFDVRVAAPMWRVDQWVFVWAEHDWILILTQGVLLGVPLGLSIACYLWVTYPSRRGR
jgi:hypothetical protein